MTRASCVFVLQFSNDHVSREGSIKLNLEKYLGEHNTEATLLLFVRYFMSVLGLPLTENMDALRLQTSRKGVTQEKPTEQGRLLQMGQQANRRESKCCIFRKGFTLGW